MRVAEIVLERGPSRTLAYHNRMQVIKKLALKFNSAWLERIKDGTKDPKAALIDLLVSVTGSGSDDDTDETLMELTQVINEVVAIVKGRPLSSPGELDRIKKLTLPKIQELLYMAAANKYPTKTSKDDEKDPHMYGMDGRKLSIEFQPYKAKYYFYGDKTARHAISGPKDANIIFQYRNKMFYGLLRQTRGGRKYVQTEFTQLEKADIAMVPDRLKTAPAP